MRKRQLPPPRFTAQHAKAISEVFGPGAYVELYLDHPAVGCGWRRYLVLRLGPKWVRIICTENAEALSISRIAFLPRQPTFPVKRTRLARRLKAIAADYGKASSTDVKMALGILRTQAAR